MALRSFADGALFAEVLGEGPPRILALHGWGRRGADFGPSLAGLPALAPDLPGFGASPPPYEPLGAPGYADAVGVLLDEMDGPAVLVGHSFGGRVAICLAAAQPQRVEGVVLTGTPVLRLRPPARPQVGYRLVRAANRAGLVPDEVLERLRRRVGSADYRTATGVMRQVLVRVVAETYEDELAEVRAPVRFLWGEADSEVPLEVAQRAIALRLDAGLRSDLEVVPGVGHLLPVEAPQSLRDAVSEMLR